MCGIAGVWGHVSEARLRAMADRLRHRGPDDDGSWIDPAAGIGLTYRRLAIIDLADGQQPFINETGQVVSVCNGEIYNYIELREGLLSRGHTLRSKADTEVIVHLYEEHGVEFVQKLRGMFAIALWDASQQQLVLVRDRAGKKPLYFSQVNDEFVFASEIKGVLGGLRERPRRCDQSVVDYLTYGFVPTPTTIYSGVESVEPGQCLLAQDRRVVARNRYWRLQLEPKVSVGQNEAVEQIDATLREAVRIRLRSDVPVGCFLSAGIDSGIVSAMAAQESTGTLRTLTVGFEDDTFDERPGARRVAERYGTDHQELTLRPDVVNELPAIVRTYDQPFGDSSAIPSYYIAREARRHLKVVLNGDGGDEIAAGYRRYVAGWLTAKLNRLDNRGGRSLWRTLQRILPVSSEYRTAYAFLHRIVRGWAMNPLDRYVSWTYDGMDDQQLRALCGRSNGSDDRNWLGSTERGSRIAHQAMAAHCDSGTIDQMLGADFDLMLPGDFLTKVDMATMAHGLEARSPFLDQELIDLFAHMPEGLKLNGRTTKPLLRELSRRYLPDGADLAPKRGFEVPLVKWLGGELRDFSADVILSRNGLVAQLFDREALERLLHNPQVEPARWSRWVWFLMMLGLWDRIVYRELAITQTW